MRFSKILLSLIPGIPRIHHASPGRGLLIFCLFALLLNGYFMAGFLIASRTLRVALLAASIVTWALAFYDGVRVSAASSRSQGGP